MTNSQDTGRHHLELVRDIRVDIAPDNRPTITSGPSHHQYRYSRLARWSYRYWAVGITVAAQLVIAAAIALGGDPIIGAGAAVVMLLCGLALITAEVATRRAIARTLTPEQLTTDAGRSELGER